MNDLEKYFNNNKNRLIHKWMHFFEIYDNHFSRFRNTSVNILEIGVFQGGSLQMWKNYFGNKCKIYGIDINPECSVFSEDQIEIIIGSQDDRSFLKSLADKIPEIDILIDDGGHLMSQQINTFEILFPHISENGIYLCEDLHTSYWKGYGGGYKKSGTFIEYSKNLIDKLNAWHSEESNLRITDFTKSAHSLHYYDSILVIEKRKITKPFSKKTGIETISEYKYKPKNESIKLVTLISKIKKILFNLLTFRK